MNKVEEELLICEMVGVLENLTRKSSTQVHTCVLRIYSS